MNNSKIRKKSNYYALKGKKEEDNIISKKYFGDIEVIGKHHKEEGVGQYYFCICHKCCVPVLLSYSQLSNPHITDCGCESLGLHHNFDIIDKPFDGLTPRRIKYRKNGVDMYECECICKSLFTATEDELVNRKKKSCGCLSSLIFNRKTDLQYPDTEPGVSNPKVSEYHRKKNLEISIRMKMEQKLSVNDNGDIIGIDGRIYPLRFIKEKQIWLEKQ